jgi:hypothetical protein
VSRADLYDAEHAAVRRAMLAVYSPADPCWRCGRPLGPDPGMLDCGHRDDGPGWAGLEHRHCSRAAGARKGNRQRRQQRRWRMDGIGTGTLGVEVSEDRQHTAVCSACSLPDGRVQVELVAYLPGTATAVDRIVELCGRWKVLGVVIDPMGGATNLRQPLRSHPGVHVVEPATADVKVAHADFLDLAHARRLQVVSNETLTAAVQHLSERMLGGQPVFDRRGAPIDVSPAIASELAVWGLQTAPPPRTPFAITGTAAPGSVRPTPWGPAYPVGRAGR